MTDWKWGARGELTLDGQKFQAQFDKLGPLREYAKELSEAIEVLTALERARLAFEEGRASSYADSARRVRELLRERDVAAETLAALVSAVDRWFDPNGITLKFGENGQELRRFLAEAIDVLPKLQQTVEAASKAQIEKESEVK